MPPFATVVAGQIRFLLQSCGDSDFDPTYRELCQFVEHGTEGSIILLQLCLGQLNHNEAGIQNVQRRLDLVSAIFRYLLERPNFSTILCEALGATSMTEGFLENLSSTLNLSVPEKIGVGLALSDSDSLDIRTRGQNFCIVQIDELCANPTPEVSNERIQEIIMFLHRSEGLSKHVDSFIKMLSLLQLKESSFFALAPMLPDNMRVANSNLFFESSNNDFDDLLEEIEKEMSMADIVRELGYGCTVNTSHCKEMLSLFLPLNEATLSKLLSTIARTHIGLEDAHNTHSMFCSALLSSSAGDSSWSNSWNVDVLVDSIKELAPNTKWTLVMENLDHDGFYVHDETALSILMSIYHKACQDPFPLHAICGSIWKNTEGQLSFLKHAVSAPPNVFTFAHASRQLTNLEAAHLSSGHGNGAWYCLDLLEVLCQLAERGHAAAVRLMLEYPLNHCPEVLLVGMSKIDTAYNLLQYEVSSTIFPEIFKDPMKCSVICHLWHVNPNMVLREFLNLHYADENSLLRIMEICQELKILPSVLDITPSPFSIKLAAIASQKEHLNLEKWLNENLSTHKDAFLEDCLKFLKETLSNAANDPHDGLLKQSRSAVANIYQETCSIFLKVLQAHSEQIVSHQLFEEIKRLHVSSSPRVQTTVATELSTVQGSSDDIEAEANAYFHQMFSEQLSIDAMVQMLFRLKESSDKREQMIFDCIIANLFEEYKYFPKYPDRQLKLAAILFGSLIKHQLVTHLTLGIALRGVLDALRKSVDSKMFLFGTTALEQFMDRLVEWPQYCNHILQISHFRGAHAELVSVIERALAQVSSSQAELNGGNSLSADQQQGSAPPSVESMEASEASWPLVRSSSMQSGQQLSPFQQQWHQGILDDRFKTSAASGNYTKPLLSHAGQSSIMSAPVDSLSSQKATALQNLQTPSSQHSASGAATLSSSPGFLRPSRSITPAGMLRQSSYSTGFGAALNIETLVAAAERRDTPIEAPASEVQDKILFMINNISTANMDAKAKEFTEVLKEQYYPWFAQYMVMKRASIEPNFHDLYLKFLDKVNSRSLNKEIVKATYENCKVLLRSDLIKSSSEERSLLKNLGSWLGKFTIGRNQALRAREIDPKILIIEAYEKGLMIAVIPFTSKILEPCQCSLAYQPPNPWTMGILGLLTEIYNLPNLKMNLKFDIEVLFKNLGVDMKEVKPTSLLKDRAREVEGNPDFSNKDIGVSQPAAVSEMNSGIVPTLSHMEEVNNSSFQSTHSNVLNQGYNTNLHIASNAMAEEDKSGPIILTERVGSGQGLAQVTPPPLPFSLEMLAPLISSCEPYIRVNPNLTSMGMQLQFHRIIQVALDRAIKDILSPVIQRSVTIASRTTKELVLKDYAMESDGNAISSAARMMVGRLAGSLAHVTCKEPLRGALSNHLRSVLQALNVGNDADQIVQIITTDHLDLGCAVIENVATHKAMELIDGEIAPSFASLRKQREAAGTAYYDAGTYAQGSFACVPETLRPKPGHLSFSQQQVYKDFARNTWQTQTISSSSAPRSGAPSASAGSVNNVLPRVYSGSSGQLNASIYSTSQATPGLGAVSPPLDLASEESDRGQMQHISVSSAHVGADEAVTQQSADMTSFPVIVNPSESNMLDTSTVTKEMVGTMPPTSTNPTSEHLAAALPESLLTTREVLDKYQVVAQKLTALIGKDAKDAEIQVVVSEVSDILLKCASRDEAAMAVAPKVFKGLYESMSNSHITTHLAVLAAIRDVCKLVVKELTSWVICSDEERKFNKEITIGLIRSELLNLAEYNVHLAKLIDGGRNKAATEFAISLVQALVVQEPGVSMTEFYNLIEALEKLSLRPGSPESLQQLLEIVRNASTNGTPLSGYPANKEDKARLSRDKKALSGRTLVGREENNVTDSVLEDPSGFRDQVSLFFAEWCRTYDLPGTSDAVHTHYISQLQQNGWLKGDDVTENFFRILTELSVSYCVAPEQSPLSFQLQPTQQTQQLSFIAIDTYAKLVVLVMKYCLVDQGSSKVTLLPKILAVAAKVIQKDAEEKKAYFNPRPYFRLFINMLLDLASLDPVLDTTNFQVLTAFASVFHVLQPLKVPGWSFAWLELVSHKSFMPKLLTLNSPKGWPFFQRLLVDLFKFMEPYLRNAELGESVRFLYKGTLRVLLVLLHDFPGFLCEYHFSFCDVIPPSCIQMRNVILSAFPRNMRLPDPSTPNLKIDLLAEISQPPRILSDVDGALKAKQIKADIDEYLKTRAEGSAFMENLKQRLLLSPTEASMAGTRYNVPLLNSLVLYVGMQAIQQLQSKSSPQHASTQQLAHNAPMDIFLASAAMDIFQNLIKNLDTEGRYLFLNAVANQLRYPNNHTHYFSFVLLYLFAEASQDIIQEQITRVLLERLIVNRPHPWGLLITFIELIKNPRYSFWSRPFTRCAPEIEKLFESVSRSCGGPKAVDDGMVSGGIPDGIH